MMGPPGFLPTPWFQKVTNVQAFQHPGGGTQSKGAIDPAANQLSTVQFVRDEPFTNPPMRNRPVDEGGHQLFRGWIMETQPNANFGGTDGSAISADQLYRLNFLFNPGSVDQSWDFDTTTDPQQLMIAGTTPGAVASKGIRFGFNLLFDRRRKIDRISAPDGVMADIRILSKILSGSSGGPGTQLNVGMYKPVWVALGRSIQPFTNPGEPNIVPSLAYPLGAIGFIESCSVQYTIFSADMTPLQCAVTVTLLVNYWLPAFPTIKEKIIDPTMTRVPTP